MSNSGREYHQNFRVGHPQSGLSKSVGSNNPHSSGRSSEDHSDESKSGSNRGFEDYGSQKERSFNEKGEREKEKSALHQRNVGSFRSKGSEQGKAIHGQRKIQFRVVRAIEDEYSYAPNKKEAIIGKGAYSIVYRATRNNISSSMSSKNEEAEWVDESLFSVSPSLSPPPSGTIVALKVISKVPEGFSVHTANGTIVPNTQTVTTAAALPPSNTTAVGDKEKARSVFDDRRDDTLRELEVLNRLRCEAKNNSATPRSSTYNGCLQLVDAIETETQWCLVTTYDPHALDLGTYYKKKVTSDRRPTEGGPSYHSPAISEQHASLIILQLLCIVSKLHEEQRLVHRDLKPENILIAPVPHSRKERGSLSEDPDTATSRAGSEVVFDFQESPTDENKKAVRRSQSVSTFPGTLLHSEDDAKKNADENKKKGILLPPVALQTNLALVSNNNNNNSNLPSPLASAEVFDGGLVTLLDFGFSRFLHTDAVLVKSSGCCDHGEKGHSANNNDNDEARDSSEYKKHHEGSSGIIVTPVSTIHNQTSSEGVTNTTATSNDMYSSLIESPVIPRTPQLFPSIYPNSGSPPMTAPNSGNYKITDNYESNTLVSQKGIDDGELPVSLIGSSGCSLCQSNNKRTGPNHQQSCSHPPAPLLLLTACGTDKYLPYEVLLWSMKRSFYPSPPAGLPPSHHLLSSRQPHLRPTTIAHAKALDAYAIGVIAHILLSGKVPFDGSSRTTLFLQQHALQSSPAKAHLVQQVVSTESSQSGLGSTQVVRNEEGICTLESPSWKSVSEEAKTLVRGLLHVNPDKRWSVERALQSRWVHEVAIPVARQVLPPECLVGLMQVGILTATK